LLALMYYFFVSMYSEYGLTSSQNEPIKMMLFFTLT